MKRMMHPQHGWHHAYSPQEEEVMRKNGWVDDVPAAPSQEDEIAKVRSQLDAAGILWDGRWGLARLQEALAGSE